MSEAAAVLDGYLASGLRSMEVMRLLHERGRNLHFNDVEFVMDDEASDSEEGEEIYAFSSYVDAMAVMRGNR